MRLDKRERRTNIVLTDGRQITVGAAIDIDRGIWCLTPTGLLRWMTADDARKIAAEYLACAEHLDANPATPSRKASR